MSAGRPRALRRAGIALVVAALVGGCGSVGGGPPSTTTTATNAAEPVRTSVSSGWLMTRQAISEVTSEPAVRQELTASPIDELLTAGQAPLVGVTARLVVSFASSTTLESAIRGGALPAHAYGVLYDPEAWAFTPTYQQQHPVLATAAAAAVAHAHGLRFLVSPALNLTTVLAPAATGTRAARYLAERLPGRVAHDADVVELQAQSLERNTAAYRAFVTAGALEARATNPHVRVLAGLSTNPPGAPVSAAQLRSDIAATEASAQGYWLNVPGQGARCPTCNASEPGIAAALILDR